MKVQTKTKTKIKLEIPDYVKEYFWEIDTDKLDINKRQEYIIARLLEYGRPESVKWLFDNYNREKIKKIILNTRSLSLKSANFWSEYFKIPKNKILCLKKSYQKMQKTHWPY